jgi:hypothetical protein
MKLARRVVHRHAVDGGEIAPLVRFARRGRQRQRSDRGGALERRRMGRGRARPVANVGRLAHDLCLERALPAQPVDQGRHRIAAIAGLDDIIEGQPVGFEFLFARVSPQREQPVLRHRTADGDRPAGGGGLDRGVEHALADARALSGVALNQMAEFVTDRGSQLGLVLEQGQQPARDEDVGLDRMRIGDRRIQNDEAEAADAGGRDHALPDPVDIGLEGGVRVGRSDEFLDPLGQDDGSASGRRSRGGGRRLDGRRAGDDAGQQRDQRQKTANFHYSSWDQPTLDGRWTAPQSPARLARRPPLWH